MSPTGHESSCNFAEIDSLMRFQFGVQLKDIAIKKRHEYSSNLICVPDSILKRDCKADVYSVGMLVLQLVLGIDFNKSGEADQLKKVEPFSVNLTDEFMAVLRRFFSGNNHIDWFLEQEYFRSVSTEYHVTSTV